MKESPRLSVQLSILVSLALLKSAGLQSCSETFQIRQNIGNNPGETISVVTFQVSQAKAGIFDGVESFPVSLNGFEALVRCESSGRRFGAVCGL